MQEEWKKIEEYPKYEVSNTGQVRNSKGVILRPQPNAKNSYFQVLLWKNSKAKCCYVHRLVAEAFVERENDDQIYVWFKDDNVQNNNADNLFWKNVKRNNNLKAKEDGKKYFG